MSKRITCNTINGVKLISNEYQNSLLIHTNTAQMFNTVNSLVSNPDSNRTITNSSIKTQNDLFAKNVLDCNTGSTKVITRDYFNFNQDYYLDDINENEILCSEKIIKKEKTSLKFKVDIEVDKSIFRCSRCNKNYRNKTLLKNHETNICKNKQIKKSKELFKCGHLDCTLEFKTDKQHVNHHNKIDPECLADKNVIIKIISLYKRFYFEMVDKYKMSNSILKDDSYLELNDIYSDVEKSLSDPLFLFLFLENPLTI